MTSLFFETFIIQLFVGMLFLMLGIWAGRFLFLGTGQEVTPSLSDKTLEQAAAKTSDDGAVALKALREESRQLRTLNDRLEKELRNLKKATESKANASAKVEPKVAAEKPEKETDKTGDDVAQPLIETSDVKDDLLQIRGIGKVMADKLGKRGIFTFQQIAEWKKEEINKLPFKNRVARDKWQAQAKRLHKEKYGS